MQKKKRNIDGKIKKRKERIQVILVIDEEEGQESVKKTIEDNTPYIVHSIGY